MVGRVRNRTHTVTMHVAPGASWRDEPCVIVRADQKNIINWRYESNWEDRG